MRTIKSLVKKEHATMPTASVRLAGSHACDHLEEQDACHRCCEVLRCDCTAGLRGFRGSSHHRGSRFCTGSRMGIQLSLFVSRMGIHCRFLGGSFSCEKATEKCLGVCIEALITRGQRSCVHCKVGNTIQIFSCRCAEVVQQPLCCCLNSSCITVWEPLTQRNFRVLGSKCRHCEEWHQEGKTHHHCRSILTTVTETGLGFRCK